MDDAKSKACGAIDRESATLRELSLDLWNHPELAFEEHHAHKLLTDFLEHKGFQVERQFTLDTAFRATLSSEDASPDKATIGVMCEYDALPGIGHACGHNLIAILGVSVALGIKEAFEKAGIQGKLIVLGCPAEEGGGGKVDLINAGAFAPMDIAMMAHPSQLNVPRPVCLAMNDVTVTFHGKASHASSAPWDGVNALDAAVLCYQNISCMRQQMKPTWTVHGIFTKGGEKPNIIPETAELLYYARAPSSKELKELIQKLCGCFQGAAAASGCKVTYEFNKKGYDSLMSSDRLASLYERNGEAVGIVFESDHAKLAKSSGSTDMGNVSKVLPSIHPNYSLNTLVPAHTAEFRELAWKEESHEETLKHAKALTMAAIDVFNDPSLTKKMKEDFQAQLARES